MRKHQCHQYGAAVEQLYLPRREGGRGLQNVLNVWEQEAVSTACYLVTSDDPNIQGVVREQFKRKRRGGMYRIIAAAQKVITRYNLPYIL